MKKKFKWWDNAVLYLIITFALVFLGQLTGACLIEVPIAVWAGFRAGQTGTDIMSIYERIPGGVTTATMYLMFIGIWMLSLAYFFVPWERPMFKAISTKIKGNNVKNLLIGLAWGGGMNALCVLAAYLNGDIHLYFDSFKPISFVLIFLCVFVQSSAEELVCRGYLMQRMLKRYKHPMVGVIGNAVLFSMLHLGNSGVTPLALLNILVYGILCSFIVYYMDSIWCAFAVHASWNFTQNIIFGLPNSGNVVPYSVFKLDASTATDSWAYNVGFGVESTIFAAVMLIIVCILLYVWGNKTGRKITNIWPEEVQKPVAATEENA